MHKVNYLTYCTNIHPGETIHEIKQHLLNYTARLFTGDKPTGLRLSARSTEELLCNDALDHFCEFLNEHRIMVPFINGFPYGNFHKQKVKENVYFPDWTDKRRVAYTSQLMHCISRMPGPDSRSISTVPCSYKTASPDNNSLLQLQSAQNLCHSILNAKKIYQETGISISIDLEPEIDCLLENSQDVINFFEQFLRPACQKHSIPEHEIAQFCGVCFDSCHYAVVHADPYDSVTLLRKYGITIHRMQISSALKVTIRNKEDLALLKDFNDPVYLHQTSIRKKTPSSQSLTDLHRFKDLPDAFLSEILGEWRIHYHIPIFMKQEDFHYTGFDSTGDELAIHTQLLLPECNFFEVETYTYDVLPNFIKEDLLQSLHKELMFANNKLNIHAITD